MTPEQNEARKKLLAARKRLRDAMADVAIMDEVSKPYREALAAAEAEAERARDEYDKLQPPASSGIARTEDMEKKAKKQTAAEEAGIKVGDKFETGIKKSKTFKVTSLSQGGKIVYDNRGNGQQIRISTLTRWRKVREFSK